MVGATLLRCDFQRIFVWVIELGFKQAVIIVNIELTCVQALIHLITPRLSPPRCAIKIKLLRNYVESKAHVYDEQNGVKSPLFRLSHIV